MKRNIIALCTVAALVLGACGAEEKEDTVEENKAVQTEDKESTQEDEENSFVAEEENTFVEEEKVSDPELLEKMEGMLIELETAVEDYCNCMETAKTNRDCRHEFAKLNFSLEQGEVDRLNHDDMMDMMKRSSKILEASSACEKDFD